MLQRRHKRLRHKAPAQICVFRGLNLPVEYKGQIEDLSVKGISLTLSEHPSEEIETACKARVSILREDGTIVNANGSVVRSTSNTSGSHEIAIRFDRAYYNFVVDMRQHQQAFINLDPEACNRARAMLDQFDTPEAPASSLST
ncbi:MAG TPA: PilZ domain-containing protein [Armatimonadota bacterium]|nr:PilZ domain-containing protein [Armatimonadota bacterium]